MVRISNKISDVIELSNLYKNGALNSEVTTLTPQILPKSELVPLIEAANNQLVKGHIATHPKDFYDRSIGVARAWSDKNKKLQLYFFIPFMKQMSKILKDSTDRVGFLQSMGRATQQLLNDHESQVLSDSDVWEYTQTSGIAATWIGIILTIWRTFHHQQTKAIEHKTKKDEEEEGEEDSTLKMRCKDVTVKIEDDE